MDINTKKQFIKNFLELSKNERETHEDDFIKRIFHKAEAATKQLEILKQLKSICKHKRTLLTTKISNIKHQIHPINCLISNLENIINDIEEQQTEEQKISKEELIIELDAIQKEKRFKNFYLYDDLLKITIPNIKIKDDINDYEVGDCEIEISLTYNNEESSIIDLIKIYPENDHPHIADAGGYICPGSGEELMIKAFNQGRFLDLLYLIETFLKGFNPSSPMVDIDGLYFKCQECKSEICSEISDSYICSKCEKLICFDCLYGELCKSCYQKD